MRDPVHAVAARATIAIAAAGMLAFAAAAIGVHLARPDLDGRHAQMSRYLLQPHGEWLQAGYCGLAAAIVAIGIGARRALRPEARSAAPLLLFATGALALVTTAFAPMTADGADPDLIGWLHGVCAQAAFLCTIVAMLLQSAWMRRDPRWRPRFPWAFGIAGVAFAGLWALVLVRDLPRGAAQKAVIAIVALWFVAVWRWLLRDRPAPAAGAGPGEAGG